MLMDTNLLSVCDTSIIEFLSWEPAKCLNVDTLTVAVLLQGNMHFLFVKVCEYGQ
jgi:hypothetical protein